MGAPAAGAVLALKAPPRASASRREDTVIWGSSRRYPFGLNMPGVATAQHRISQEDDTHLHKVTMSWEETAAGPRAGEPALGGAMTTVLPVRGQKPPTLGK